VIGVGGMTVLFFFCTYPCLLVFSFWEPSACFTSITTNKEKSPKFINYLLDAALNWDITEDGITTEACLMAGFNPDEIDSD
jgi:hypothetical protein